MTKKPLTTDEIQNAIASELKISRTEQDKLWSTASKTFQLGHQPAEVQALAKRYYLVGLLVGATREALAIS